MGQPFQLVSSAFDDGDTMPLRFTCKGDNVSPPLSISDIPLDTASLALIMHEAGMSFELPKVEQADSVKPTP